METCSNTSRDSATDIAWLHFDHRIFAGWLCCCLQDVVAYLEFLVLRAIFEVYEGNRTYAADRVKDDIDNISKPANASDLEQRIAEYPQQGIEALVSCICPHLSLGALLSRERMLAASRLPKAKSKRQ